MTTQPYTQIAAFRVPDDSLEPSDAVLSVGVRQRPKGDVYLATHTTVGDVAEIHLDMQDGRPTLLVALHDWTGVMVVDLRDGTVAQRADNY